MVTLEKTPVTVVLAFVTGFVLGGAFALLGLPIPAPSALAGVAGVLGITLSFMLVEWIRR